VTEKLKQYLFLALAGIGALCGVVAAGYFFAQEKSEPVYLSKIDRLMFNEKNQPPKVILTLPDYKKQQEAKETTPPKNDINVVPEEGKPAAPAKPKKQITMEDLLLQIPNLAKLQAKEPTQTLKYLTQRDDMTEERGEIILPNISSKGKKPWVEYGKRVKVLPTFKKVAVVIKGMGFDDLSLQQISKGLPSEISFSFTPYGQNLDKKIIQARSQGHETYMDLLLSSKDFLKSDSGPMSLSLTISDEESLERLHRLIARKAAVGGVIVNDGIADEDNKAILEKVLTELKNRGLLMIDAVNGNGIDNIKIQNLPRQKADVVIEDILNQDKIKEKIKEAEDIALTKGQVLLVVENKPVIVMAVYDWINSFSPQLTYEEAKNKELTLPLALVPVSNLVVE